MYDIRAGWVVKKLKTKKKRSMAKRKQITTAKRNLSHVVLFPIQFFLGLERSYHPINLYMYIQLCSRLVVFAPRAENEVMIG